MFTRLRAFRVRATLLVALAGLALGLGTCNLSGKLEPRGIGHVDRRAVACDAGSRGWCLVLREPFELEPPYHGGTLTALGENGAVAGTLLREVDRPFTWRADDGRLTLWDQLLPESPASIEAILPDGIVCGSRFEPEPDAGVIVSTAIIGGDAGFQRLLPDPRQGGCSDMNVSRTAIGTWDSQAFIRWSDGGVFRFDVFLDPRVDGGVPRYLGVTVNALNQREEVVGALAGGNFYGRAFAAGFYWSADAGPVLLQNEATQPLLATQANDVNDRGVIAGWGQDSRGDTTACTWAGPGAPPAYLSRPESRFDTTEAFSINDKGLVVGSGTDHSNPNIPVGFETSGIMWWKGRPYLLDSLFAGSTTLHIESLSFVSNGDRIAGTGRRLILAGDGGFERSIRYPLVIDVLRYPE